VVPESDIQHTSGRQTTIHVATPLVSTSIDPELKPASQNLTVAPHTLQVESSAYSEEPVVYSDLPLVYSEEPVIHSDVPLLYSKEPLVYSKEPVVYSEEPIVYREEHPKDVVRVVQTLLLNNVEIDDDDDDDDDNDDDDDEDILDDKGIKSEEASTTSIQLTEIKSHPVGLLNDSDTANISAIVFHDNERISNQYGDDRIVALSINEAESKPNTSNKSKISSSEVVHTDRLASSTADRQASNTSDRLASTTADKLASSTVTADELASIPADELASSTGDKVASSTANSDELKVSEVSTDVDKESFIDIRSSVDDLFVVDNVGDLLKEIYAVCDTIKQETTSDNKDDNSYKISEEQLVNYSSQSSDELINEHSTETESKSLCEYAEDVVNANEDKSNKNQINSKVTIEKTNNGNDSDEDTAILLPLPKPKRSGVKQLYSSMSADTSSEAVISPKRSVGDVLNDFEMEISRFETALPDAHEDEIRLPIAKKKKKKGETTENQLQANKYMFKNPTEKKTENDTWDDTKYPKIIIDNLMDSRKSYLGLSENNHVSIELKCIEQKVSVEHEDRLHKTINVHTTHDRDYNNDSNGQSIKHELLSPSDDVMNSNSWTSSTNTTSKQVDSTHDIDSVRKDTDNEGNVSITASRHEDVIARSVHPVITQSSLTVVLKPSTTKITSKNKAVPITLTERMADTDEIILPLPKRRGKTDSENPTELVVIDDKNQIVNVEQLPTEENNLCNDAMTKIFVCSGSMDDFSNSSNDTNSKVEDNIHIKNNSKTSNSDELHTTHQRKSSSDSRKSDQLPPKIKHRKCSSDSRHSEVLLHDKKWHKNSSDCPQIEELIAGKPHKSSSGSVEPVEHLSTSQNLSGSNSHELDELQVFKLHKSSPNNDQSSELPATKQHSSNSRQADKIYNKPHKSHSSSHQAEESSIIKLPKSSSDSFQSQEVLAAKQRKSSSYKHEHDEIQVLEPHKNNSDRRQSEGLPAMKQRKSSSDSHQSDLIPVMKQSKNSLDDHQIENLPTLQPSPHQEITSSSNIVNVTSMEKITSEKPDTHNHDYIPQYNEQLTANNNPEPIQPDTSTFSVDILFNKITRTISKEGVVPNKQQLSSKRKLNFSSSMVDEELPDESMRSPTNETQFNSPVFDTDVQLTTQADNHGSVPSQAKSNLSKREQSDISSAQYPSDLLTSQSSVTENVQIQEGKLDFNKPGPNGHQVNKLEPGEHQHDQNSNNRNIFKDGRDENPKVKERKKVNLPVITIQDKLIGDVRHEQISKINDRIKFSPSVKFNNVDDANSIKAKSKICEFELSLDEHERKTSSDPVDQTPTFDFFFSLPGSKPKKIQHPFIENTSMHAESISLVHSLPTYKRKVNKTSDMNKDLSSPSKAKIVEDTQDQLVTVQNEDKLFHTQQNSKHTEYLQSTQLLPDSVSSNRDISSNVVEQNLKHAVSFPEKQMLPDRQPRKSQQSKMDRDIHTLDLLQHIEVIKGKSVEKIENLNDVRSAHVAPAQQGDKTKDEQQSNTEQNVQYPSSSGSKLATPGSLPKQDQSNEIKQESKHSKSPRSTQAHSGSEVKNHESYSFKQDLEHTRSVGNQVTEHQSTEVEQDSKHARSSESTRTQSESQMKEHKPYEMEQVSKHSSSPHSMQPQRNPSVIVRPIKTASDIDDIFPSGTSTSNQSNKRIPRNKSFQSENDSTRNEITSQHVGKSSRSLVENPSDEFRGARHEAVNQNQHLEKNNLTRAKGAVSEAKWSVTDARGAVVETKNAETDKKGAVTDAKGAVTEVKGVLTNKGGTVNEKALKSSLNSDINKKDVKLEIVKVRKHNRHVVVSTMPSNNQKTSGIDKHSESEDINVHQDADRSAAVGSVVNEANTRSKDNVNRENKMIENSSLESDEYRMEIKPMSWDQRHVLKDKTDDRKLEKPLRTLNIAQQFEELARSSKKPPTGEVHSRPAQLVRKSSRLSSQRSLEDITSDSDSVLRSNRPAGHSVQAYMSDSERTYTPRSRSKSLGTSAAFVAYDTQLSYTLPSESTNIEHASDVSTSSERWPKSKDGYVAVVIPDHTQLRVKNAPNSQNKSTTFVTASNPVILSDQKPNENRVIANESSSRRHVIVSEQNTRETSKNINISSSTQNLSTSTESKTLSKSFDVVRRSSTQSDRNNKPISGKHTAHGGRNIQVHEEVPAPGTIPSIASLTAKFLTAASENNEKGEAGSRSITTRPVRESKQPGAQANSQSRNHSASPSPARNVTILTISSTPDEGTWTGDDGKMSEKLMFAKASLKSNNTVPGPVSLRFNADGSTDQIVRVPRTGHTRAAASGRPPPAH